MEKQIIYNVLDGEITFDPQIVEYGRLREEFNDYDDELAQSISKFYEENKSSIMDMYLGENKYYDFMFRLYAEITENIKEHMKKYINIMIDHGVYDVEEDYFTSTANDSLVRLLEIAGKEHEIKCILWEHHTDMFNSGLDEASNKGFSVGKAAVGAVLLGPVGLVGGALGKKKQCYYCGKCGFNHEY